MNILSETNTKKDFERREGKDEIQKKEAKFLKNSNLFEFRYEWI